MTVSSLSDIPVPSFGIECFRDVWKTTAKVRFAVGIALASGAAIAASSWMFAVAGWAVACRSVLGGIGTFFALESLFRSSKEHGNATKIALATAACVSAILALPSAEAVEIAEEFISPSPSWNAHALPFSSSASVGETDSLTADDVRKIFDDVREDHPNQSYVTLEQSVRRVEGLSAGVPLSESVRLNAEVPYVSAFVADPNGKIVSAMNDLGFFPNGFSKEAFESVTRSLSSEEIENVLLRAYGSSGIDDAAIVADAMGNRPEDLEEAPVQDARNSDAHVPHAQNPSGISLPWLAPALAVSGVAALWWKWFRHRPSKRNRRPIRRPLDRSPQPQSFQSVLPNVSTEPRFETIPSISWEFRVSLEPNATGSSLRFVWIEAEKERFVTTRPLSGGSNQNRGEFDAALSDAYYEFAHFREKAKARELRDLGTYVLSRSDAESIFRQLEHPKTVSQNRETGGFWFSSGYAAHDGRLPLKNLANPPFERIDATSVEFSIRPDAWEPYATEHFSKAFRDFPEAERTLFLSASRRAAEESGNSNPFPHALDFFNWHKHPGGPLWPSDGDINHPDSAPGKFEDSPSLEIVPFVIANQMTPPVAASAKDFPNSLVLAGKDFGASRDYLLTAWKLLRISEREALRRRRFISRVGVAKSAELWLCDSRGRLLHLSRKVRHGKTVFEPDLRPVNIVLGSGE